MCIILAKLIDKNNLISSRKLVMIPEQNTLKSDARMLFGIACLLIIIGIIFVYSASSVYALEKCKNANFYLKKHLLGFVIGLIGLIIGRYTPLRLIQKLSPLFFLGTLILTWLSYVPGFAVQIHGSSRWINLANITFQPSELLKLSFVLYFAFLLSKKELTIRSLRNTYIPQLIILGITSITLLKQPDFGMTTTIAITAFTLMFIAGVPMRYLAISISALLPLAIWLIWSKPYRLKRILTFINPWADPQGSGFQIIQSLIAIGSGGLWGVGIAHSQQKFFYLPMQHTDFIFSIIAEETGFIGSTFVVLLYLLFLYIGIRIVCQIKNQFASYTVLGFIVMTSLQVVINIAVATGIAPTKGVGLPFISYGNSALLCNLIILGIIINCSYTEQQTQTKIAR